MSKKVAEFLQENICVFSKMVKIGVVPSSILTHYQIYAFYSTLAKTPSKMDRYQFTADSLKINTTTVRNAVREMEKTVK